MIRRREPNPPPMTPARTESTAVGAHTQPAPGTVDPEPMYAPTPVAQPAPAPPADRNVTVIGKGARLEGNLVSSASLRIEGAVKGQINAEGDVVVAEGAEVAADIKASNVTVAGTYSGNINASGTLELTSSAKVDGNVSSAAFVVASGAVFTGQSQMGAPGAGSGQKAPGTPQSGSAPKPEAPVPPAPGEAPKAQSPTQPSAKG